MDGELLQAAKEDRQMVRSHLLQVETENKELRDPAIGVYHQESAVRQTDQFAEEHAATVSERPVRHHSEKKVLH